MSQTKHTSRAILNAPQKCVQEKDTKNPRLLFHTHHEQAPIRLTVSTPNTSWTPHLLECGHDCWCPMSTALLCNAMPLGSYELVLTFNMSTTAHMPSTIMSVWVFAGTTDLVTLVFNSLKEGPKPNSVSMSALLWQADESYVTMKFYNISRHRLSNSF